MKKEKKDNIYFIMLILIAIVVFILLVIISGGVNFVRSEEKNGDVEYSEDSTTITAKENSNEAAAAEDVDTTAVTSEEKDLEVAEQTTSKNEIKIVEEEVTAENFLNYKENLLPSEEAVKQYEYDGFIFARSDSWLTITNSENNWKQLFDGSDYLLTEKELWFINEDRNICMFEYRDFEYPSKFKNNSSWGQDYYSSAQYHEYGNADLSQENLERVETWIERYSDFSEVAGVTAIRTYAGTLLVEGTKLNFYEKKEIIRGKKLPFELKEIAMVKNSLLRKEVMFKFVSTTNTVGVIKMSYIPFGRYEIFAIAEGEAERHLLHRTEENKIFQIETDENYAIYYEDGKLKGGNKNLHFYFDDLPWEEITIRRVSGVGKGIEEAQFSSDTISFDAMESKDIERMVEETGINY